MRIVSAVLLSLVVISCNVQNQGEMDLTGAIISGDKVNVEKFLSKGMDPNIASDEGLIPIMVATGSTNIVSDIYSSDTTDRVEEDIDILQLLLSSGANANYENNQGMTPLLNAVYNGRYRSVLLLLEHGADPNNPSEAGLTPLMYASKHCMADVAQALLSGRANIHMKTPSGETALEIAEKVACDELTVKLKDRRAN